MPNQTNDALRSKNNRSNAKQNGMCENCFKLPALINRTRCKNCLMKAIIKEGFKFDRRRKMRGSTQARGTCYVEQFQPSVRAEWINKIMVKWTGICHYTGIPIEIGATASLDHKLPVSRVHIFGPDKIFHPENLVWCHKSVNILKGDKTASEFSYWLRHEFQDALASVAAHN